MGGTQADFRELPPVDALMRHPTLATLSAEYGRGAVLDWARIALNELRAELPTAAAPSTRAVWTERAAARIEAQAAAGKRRRLQRVINATGVVLHTNLGRAPLADAAIRAVEEAARYANLELDLADGRRWNRGAQLTDLWLALTGAPASLVVNNCAAATLLVLQGLAAGREVVVSRGQLIEIGGAYRLPDVFRQSGAILREVGTTNRTRLADYENAIGPQTAALLRVHPSNFRVVGFTEEVAIGPLVELAHRRGLAAIDDVGSGLLHDLQAYGLTDEPIVQESVAAGADAVLFSGDKLLGGPQCGVILGANAVVDRLRENPLTRALRVDKLTLAALQATLEIHRAGRALTDVPVLRQLTMPASALRVRAEALRNALPKNSLVEVREGRSAVGGGSLPMTTLPTWLAAVRPADCSVEALALRLRRESPPVLGRLEGGALLLDLRTILPGEELILAGILRRVLFDGLV